jgi:hypothetical protein
MKQPLVHLVPFSHMDISWTYYAGRNLRKIGEKVTQIIGGFVDHLEADLDARFTGLSFFANIGQVVAEKPELHDRIRALVADGRIDLPGHLVNSPNLGGAEFHITPESIVRNMIEGRRLHDRLYGRSDGTVLMFPDVTGSFGNLPQLLRLAGYTAYQFGRGYRHQPFPSGPFLWRGIDGSEIVASNDTRGGILKGIDDEANVAKVRGCAESAAKTGAPVMFQIGHDISEAETDEVGFARAWNERFPDLPICVSSFSCYFAALADCRDRLPQFEGTIDPIGWTATFGMHGYKERRAWGGLFDAIQETEAFAATAQGPYPERELRRAWLTGLCFQEHGAANFLVEEDHEQVYGDLAAAHHEVDKLRDVVLRNRAAALATGPCGETDCAVAVFNPLPWPRREPVEFTARFAPSDSVTDAEVVDASGSRVESQPLAASYYPQGGLREVRLLWPADVPAGGEAVYRIRPVPLGRLGVYTAREVPEWDVLENGRLRAAFRWGVVKTLDDADGRPVCVSGRTEQHGESVLASLGTVGVRVAEPPNVAYNWGMMNRFGKSVTLMSFPFRMDCIEDGPVQRTVRVTRKIGDDSLVQTYSMVAGRPALDVDVKIETQRSGYRWEMAIPFVGQRPRWRRDESFGAGDFDPADHTYVETGEAMTPGGFFCQSYVDVRFGNSERGVTVLTPNQPGFVASDEALQAVLLTTAPTRLEDRTCRFILSPATLSLGRFEFNYRLWSYDDAATHSPARRALEMRFPLRAVEAVANETGRAARSNLSVEPAHIAWSAHYVDRGRTRLRLYETEGVEADAEIRVAGADLLRPVDLCDNPTGDAVAADDGTFRAHFGPFQIRTFLVDPA